MQHIQGQPASTAYGQAAPAGEMIDSQGGGAIPALPLEVQSQNGVNFLTGGIGDEEKAQVKASEHQYNLHMLMSSPGGAFVSDVSLQIIDANGKQLVSADNAGPYFYANLPQGSYTIEMSAHGETKKIAVRIKDGKAVREMVEFKGESGGVTSPHQPTSTVD